ncbi:hypothetical protein K402DRAFT_207573 [Aulographum hederae CBS 113979]|uniref:Uncharacterized protein n=1 Tax=Aulographum hederae CBS 113979 TaxID=1176131 RepID=A0A6G1GN97_9PEZI|nr:hypothetical protein K402DRAFT_207573 [Aulographum hederae CBS 113979]
MAVPLHTIFDAWAVWPLSKHDFSYHISNLRYPYRVAPSATTNCMDMEWTKSSFRSRLKMDLRNDSGWLFWIMSFCFTLLCGFSKGKPIAI